LTGRVWQRNLYTQKNCPSQDSDFIAKFDQHKDTQFLDKSRLVTQAFEIKAKAVYRRIWEEFNRTGSTQDLAPFWRVVESNSPMAKKLNFDPAWIELQQELEKQGN
jgi:hypothetical protein